MGYQDPMQTKVETMESKDEEDHTLLERIDELNRRAVSAAPLVGPSNILASVASAMSEVRGYLVGAGGAEGETLTVGHMLLDGMEAVIVAAEEYKDDDDEQSDDRKAYRQLLADLLELAPSDDHGEYPTAAIDDLRKRARELLVNG